MRIERLDIYQVNLPLQFSFRTAYGELNASPSILVRMEGEGHYAWGETCTVYEPCYSSEHTIGIFHTVREHFAPRIIGREIESAQDILDRLAIYKGNEFAKACLEIPWWVLDSKRKGVPLHKLLGGKRDRVAVGADFGVQESLDILLSKIQAAIDDGYSRVKLKFRPGWDTNMLDAVRSTFPDFAFHIDCNAAYTLADADLFREVDGYRLAMIEQPLQDDGLSLYDHAELQKMIETPICLDESIHNLIDVQLAVRLGSCRIVNIKVARVGGLSVCLAIHDLCAEHDIPCWIGSMLESGIGGGINIELATLPNFTYPADIFPSQMFFRQEIAVPQVQLSGPAEMAASQVPGIPYEPVLDLLREHTVRHVSFEA
jgi:O-succinylbenzoate synthase